jgi:hypothetical protein
MPRYICYGLQIDSPELELPELIPSDDGRRADVRIRSGAVDSHGEPMKADRSVQWANSTEAVIYYEDAGVFLVRDGREIVIDRIPGAADTAIRLYLLGPVLSLLLHQRGLLVLHGSAANVDGAAVAFLAEKGTGKSTLAAAFGARGHGLVADDLVPVDLDASGGPTVWPGFPQLKLYAEAAAQLGPANERTSFELLPTLEKRGWRVAEAFPDGPLPLRRVYVLSDSTTGENEIAELAPGQAFAELVRHTFVLCVLNMTGSQESHFRQAVRLAQGLVPVRALRRQRTLAALPDVVRMIEADLEAG